jgi:hypothetical protein
VDGNGTVDQWSSWSVVEETYSRNPDFARIVERTPATLDLSALPPGYGFQFELRIQDATEKGSDYRFQTDDQAASQYRTETVSRPILERVRLSFQ